MRELPERERLYHIQLTQWRAHRKMRVSKRERERGGGGGERSR